MRWGLGPRTVAVSVLLALIIGAAFAVLLVAIENLRSSGREAVATREELTAADNLEKTLIDLETGLRGFVIVEKKRFLEPWRAGRAAFPQQAARLIRLSSTPTQEARARRIAEGISAYIKQYGTPLVRAAKRGDPSVRGVAATEQGRDLVDALRAQFDRFAASDRALLTSRQEAADADANRAIVFAVAGLAGSIILILGLGLVWARRSVVNPIRRTSEMAGRMAQGDLQVRLPETGVGEIGELEHSFNVMGGSLERSRDHLNRLLAEQAALRRVATLVAQAPEPATIYESVTREVGELFGADLARMERYESAGTVVGVAAWSRAEGAGLAVGTRLALDGVSIARLVEQNGAPARVDSFEDASGVIAEEARALGIRSSIGCPITVEGRLWGVIAASSKRESFFPPETEARIGEFTELVATAIANAESRDELLASRARIVTAADEARRRIKRDLHDGAQQSLVRTVITLKLARRALGEDESEVAKLLDEALEHAEGGNEELRELAHGILPAVLTRGGLRAGVESLASRLPIPVSVDVLDQRLPELVEATAYFITAEALTNVVKHAQASRAEVHAALEGDELHLTVRDDGVGAAETTGGTGLVGLKDRAAALGGDLQVDSRPGSGTTIIATLPLDREQPAGKGSVAAE